MAVKGGGCFGIVDDAMPPVEMINFAQRCIAAAVRAEHSFD